MLLKRQRRSASGTSNTWWLFVCLMIFYFLFRWHLFYSFLISGPCRTLSDYWLISGESLPSIYNLFLLAFILFAAWSAIEMIAAMAGDKSDKLVAVTVNPLILVFLAYLFYGFFKQWEYFEIQRDINLYSESFARPRAHSYEAEELFQYFLARRYCSGVTERLYPHSLEERDKLYAEFVEEGWIRR